MKLPELIYNVRSTLYNNRVPNANMLDNRHIIYWINEQRALWLKREYNQLRSPQHNEIQTLNIEMEVYDNYVYPIIKQKGYRLLKSKKKIPRTIQYNISDGILGVYGINFTERKINYTSREKVVYKGNGIFNRNKIWTFKYQDYLWVKYGDKTDKSSIINNLILEGVFENPLEVDEFNNTPNLILFGKDEYPVSEAFLPFLEEGILKFNVQYYVNDVIPNDEQEQQKTPTNRNTQKT